jgi:hypothetical protein
MYSPDENGHVVIPDTVTSIESFTFDTCTRLVSISISDSVTSINEYAFAFCTRLTSVTIPDSVEFIADLAVIGCSRLQSVFIPDTGPSVNSTIGTHAFTNCFGYGLAQIENTSPRGTVECVPCNQSSLAIPETVTVIGNFAFYSCTSLVSVVIPNSVTVIADLAFYGSVNLSSVIIPDSVAIIGDGAFGNCACDQSLYVPRLHEQLQH